MKIVNVIGGWVLILIATALLLAVVCGKVQHPFWALVVALIVGSIGASQTENAK